VYDGKVEQYQGRQIKIQYCLFSPSTEASVESRCNFAFATAAVGLALAFIWSYLQVRGRRDTTGTRGRVGSHKQRVRGFLSVPTIHR
jgi:hypothetical protein